MSNRQRPNKPWLRMGRRLNVADEAWLAFYQKQSSGPEAQQTQQRRWLDRLRRRS